MHFHPSIISMGLLLYSICIHAAELRVPDEYSNIQAAIDAADDGDTILLADGTYSGAGNIGIEWDATKKHLHIMSENGRDNCIIDCMEENRGFLLINGQDHRDVIDGLTITNGYGGGNAGGAILIDSASPRIINCMLINNSTGGDMDDVYYGGGIYTYISNPSIINNSHRYQQAARWYLSPDSGVKRTAALPAEDN